MNDISTIQQIATQSQYRETVLLVVVVIACVIALIKALAPYFKKNGTTPPPQMDSEAVRIITSRDPDGNYILLSVPRHLRDLINEIKKANDHLTHLVNHQSSMMDRISAREESNSQRIDQLEAGV